MNMPSGIYEGNRFMWFLESVRPLCAFDRMQGRTEPLGCTQQSLLTNVRPLKLSAVRGTCSHCGQKLARVFAHHMNRGLISALWKLYQAGGGPIRISEIGLTAGAEFNNFQKLRYFRLAGQGRRGQWVLTRDGADFLRGQLSVPKTVWTRTGKVVEQSIERVFIHEVWAGWIWPEDFAREAIPA